MIQNQRGMSLLEILFASMLFAILTLGVWSVFYKVYWQYTETKIMAQLQEEVRTISAFIKEEVRMAEKVTIRYGDRSGTDVISQTEDVRDEVLHSIQFWPDKMVSVDSDRLSLSSTETIGFYKLVYQSNVLSEWIKKLTVSRIQESDIILLHLVVGHPDREIQQEEIMLISLQYKK